MPTKLFLINLIDNNLFKKINNLFFFKNNIFILVKLLII